MTLLTERASIKEGKPPAPVEPEEPSEDEGKES
jgi:hypothetical protein